MPHNDHTMTVSSTQLETDTSRSASPTSTAPAVSTSSARSLGAIARQAALDLCLPLVSGALFALSFMPPPARLFAWVALVPFAAAIARPKGTAELYIGAYLGGALAHLQVLDFIRTRIGGSGLFASHETDWLVNGLLWALVWPVTLYFGRRFVRGTRLPMVCALPIIWITGEFLRQEAGWIVLKVPFPWLQIGTTQAPYPRVIQIADLAGPWAVAVVVAAVNGALFDALAQRRLRPVGVAVAILVAVLAYGEYRLRETLTIDGPTVALVAPSLQPETACRTPHPADLLLWSETVYRSSVSGPASAAIHELAADSKRAGASLVIGCAREQDGSRYNSALVVDPVRGYLGAYDKNFLVPWSEFTPWRWPGSPVEQHGFTAGATKPTFELAGFTCGASICYDACFDRSSRGYSPKPDFFVACSRESSDMTGYIRRAMLDMTRFRAVETRRAFVRNVEDGFSGIVTSTGEFIAAPEQPWKSPVSVGRVPVDRRTTLYEIAGNWLPIGCCALVAIGSFRWRRRT